MASPTRFPSGVTQAASFQPLGNIGFPDPFFYAAYEDDFLHYNSGDYTVTAAGGTVAATAANGSGGRILFTTGAVAANFAEIQLSKAGFQSTAGKRLAYRARIRVASATTSSLIAGLIGTSATPFTSVADGIYFFKAAASNILQLIVMSGSARIGTIANVGTLADNTDIDIGSRRSSDLFGVWRPGINLRTPPEGQRRAEEQREVLAGDFIDDHTLRVFLPPIPGSAA